MSTEASEKAPSRGHRRAAAPALRLLALLLAALAVAEPWLFPRLLPPGLPPPLLMAGPLLVALAALFRFDTRRGALAALAAAFAGLAALLALWPTGEAARSVAPGLAAGLLAAGLGLRVLRAGDAARMASRAAGAALFVLAILATGIALDPQPAHRLPLGGAAALAMAWAGAWLATRSLVRGPQRMARVCATGLAGLALLVMAGWWFGSAAIVQGGTRLVPMQFNTAACALLSALSLYLLLEGRRRLALAALVPVAVVAVGSLLEEYAGLALGVGEWLVAHGIVAEGVVPGRMAPNTAVGFLLGALGVLAAPSEAGRGLARWSATWACGFMVFVIAAVVLSAYVFDLPGVRGWGSHTPMALMTGAAMALLGLGLGFAGAAQRREGAHRSVWVPGVVALGTVGLSVLLWSELGGAQARQDAEALVRQSEAIRLAIDAGVAERRNALGRMGERLASMDDPARRDALFQRDAEIYLRDFPHVVALVWTDADGVVRQLRSRGQAPPERVGDRLAEDPLHAEVIERARLTGTPQWSPMVELFHGRPGELLVIPAHVGGELAGLVMAAIEFEDMFAVLVERYSPANALRVREEGRVLYSRGEPAGVPRTVRLQSLDGGLALDVWPLPRRGGNPANILLFGGLATGGLLALALRLAALAGERAELAERSGRQLQEQVREAERAREAQGAAERALADVFDSISDAFYVLDRDWRFVLANPRALQLMERTREALMGRTVWECFPDVLGTIVEARFREAMASGRTVQFEVYFEPLGRWFDARAYPRSSGLAVYFQDISDRKRAEAGQAKAQAASDRAQQLAQLGSWEYDLGTGELSWSEQTLRIFGLPPGTTVRGLATLLERVHFDDRAALQEAQRRLHAGEGDIDIEYRILRPDGEQRVLREMGTLLRDAEGRPLAATGSVQDITDRRVAEDRLREMARRLEQSLVMNRLVMEHSLDVICAFDANGRFLQASAASRAVWGHAPGELVGRAWVDLVHPDDRGAALRAAAGAMAGRPVNDLRIRCVRKDGQVVVVQWSLGWSPHDRMSFAVARDVTELDRQARALADATASLTRAQRVARMGSWEFEVATQKLAWSAEVHEIFGVPPAEFGGDYASFRARVHPDDLAALEAAQARTLAGGPELDHEHRIVLPDGRIGHVHERARLLRDDQGRPWLLSGSVQDITERKAQERALRESERRMRDTVESAFDCIVVMSAEGLILEFNPAAERTFGHRRADVIGRPLAEVIVPERHRRGHAEGLARHAAGEPGKVVGHRLEMPALRADGTELVVELAVTQLEGSEPPVFTGFMRDVTEARRARALEQGQRAILAGIASRLPLVASLTEITRLCERQLAGSLCSVLLLDAAGEHVLTGAAPSLPEAYNLAVHGLRIGPKAGSCGTAAWRREPVVVSDIATDPLWEDYRELAAAHGLRACWSVPVMSSDGRVLATFATYYRDVREPKAQEMELVSGMASLAAVAIEQARAYEDLALSEQRFRSLFDEHPDAVYSLDPEGRFTAVNEHFRQLSGFSAEQVLGRSFEPMVAPEDKEIVRGHFRAACRGEARSYEMAGIRPDGERVDLRVTNLPIMVDGRVTGVFGIAQDIRLLRKHQRDLSAALDAAENSGRQLRRLSDSAIRLNQALADEDLYQQLADALRETIGAHQALVSLNVGDTHAQHIHAVSFSAKYARWKDYATPSDGSGIYALVSEQNRPLRMTQAELEAHPRWRGFGAHAAEHPPMRGWLAVPLIGSDGRNIGQLQLSDKLRGEFTEEDELVAVQFAQMASIAIERARLIGKLSVRDRFFEMSAEVFVIFDPVAQRFAEVNPMLSQITGYTREELVSRPFTDFVHPEDVGRAMDRAETLRKKGEVIRDFAVRYVRKDGGVRWIEWLSSPAPEGLVYAVGRDVTERRKGEEVLRQTLADLDARNRELQDFAFIASHDLQEPLRKIRAFSDRLLQRHAAALPDEARDYLERSHQAAARMQTLIDDLLAYSRVSARGKPFARVDLGKVLAAVLEDLEARLESSGGEVVVEGGLPVIDADATQMRQLLQNLLANALKFRAPERRPRVVVSARAAAIDGRPAWALRVEDNGIGFEPKYADKVFAPFQRLHGRHEYEGTGIGLAIVRRIVERHGGQVQADGRPGEGAAFTITLPSSQSAPGVVTSL